MPSTDDYIKLGTQFVFTNFVQNMFPFFREEVVGLYELRNENLFVWEGVCAIAEEDESTNFFKAVGGNVLHFVVKLPQFSQITSEGYWNCVEISGRIFGHAEVYYHATDPETAGLVLEDVLRWKKQNSFLKLSVRLDPDPLRERTSSEAEARVQSWASLVENFSHDWTVVRDFNMLS
ncbi:unnamed protein product [Caenorhabditis auriculariae]|uniref:Uncharacterized protein n=1 Tax=Caenorhabditis auriculariae TaxID=2777116 RepID=A0A8S1HJ76_9PELO|nr:unnamed protein product [Caenorhabditis auriculariae]